MLKACLSIFFLFSCFSLFPQIPFEGKITYKLTTESDDRSGVIEVFYGKQKIKGILKNAGIKLKKANIMLIDFSNNLLYEIDDSTKSYTVDSIGIKSANSLFSRYQLSGKKKNILQKPCSEFYYIDTVSDDIVRNLDFLFWYADSLYFPVNDKYLGSDEIVMFTNGKNIGMGMAMKMEIFKKETFLNLQPIQIEPRQLADPLFDLPAGYTLKKKDSLQKSRESGYIEQGNNYTIEMSEIKVEEAPPPPPPPPPPPVQAKKKRKHKP